MEGKKTKLSTTLELSISYIHKNWVAAQKVKLAKLSRSKHTDSTKLAIAQKIQTKEGRFHVFVRGHNSYTLFYDKEDRVHFLSILDEEAKKTQTHISVFILMDNHFHMQVVTSKLSHLMKNVLSRYSYRFRRKYSIQGPVFKSPFGRSQIFSYLLAKENLLYILSNASRENICDTHRDYIWSSYNSHPEVIHLRENGMLPLLGKPAKSANVGIYEKNSSSSRTELQALKRRRGKLPSAEMIEQNDISKVLEVDVSFMIAAFKNLEDLDFSIHSYEPLNSGLLNTRVLNTKIINSNIPSKQSCNGQAYHKQIHNGHSINTKKNKRLAKYSSDSEVISLFMNLLDGRKITSLNTQERKQIILTLKRVKGATHRQISSIMRIDYLDLYNQGY